MVCTYEWCVYAGRFYVKCMFALILHIICPITLTAAINLLQSYFRQKHKGLTLCAVVWTALKYEKQQQQKAERRPHLFCSRNETADLELRIQLEWSTDVPRML